MEKVQAAEKTLDRRLSAYPILNQLERQTGHRKTHLVFGVVVSCFLLLLICLFPNLTTLVVALAYPTFATLKALEAHDKAADTQWLSYWLFVAIGSFVETALALPNIIPAFSVVRLVVLLWLQAPQTEGASVVYSRFVRAAVSPLLCGGRTVAGNIRTTASTAANRVEREAKNLKNRAVESARNTEAQVKQATNKAVEEASEKMHAELSDETKLD